MRLIFAAILFLISIDTQSQWFPVFNIGYARDLNGIYFINNATGYVTCAQFIFKTTNGGENWITCWQDPSRTFRGIRFINPDTGFVLAGGWIFRTINAGVNWYSVYSPVNAPSLQQIDFTDSFHGFVVGGYDFQGSFVKTTDGGSNWEHIFIYDLSPLYCVDFVNENTGYYGGGGHNEEGRIYKTTNGGLNFAERQGFGPGTTITGISMCNYDSGYAVEDFVVYHFTTDGGRYWEVRGLFHILTDVYAFNFDTVYIIGENGFITRTTNAGLSWEIQASGTTVQLRHIVFTGKDTGYIAGSYGVILKTTNGGVIAVEPISSEIPKEFNLYQNYPNPFNPATRVKYDIPKNSYIIIMVYDVLGSLVEVLVDNKLLRAGTYETTWDASKYPSGVYFCRIQSLGYTATRKMVLLK